MIQAGSTAFWVYRPDSAAGMGRIQRRAGMNGQRSTHSFLKPLFIALLLLFMAAAALPAADMEEFLPPVTCGAGWQREGNPFFYNKDTLADRLKGEAGTYFTYGFDRLAAAGYFSKKQTGAGLEVEIYRLGSPLDAFGLFASLRHKDGHALIIGADANLYASQLILYQGRHFVRIKATGAATVAPAALAACGRAVASRIPGNNSRPVELAVFTRAEMVSGSERYFPSGLLGYDFLNRGLMTDAVIDGASLQVFILLGATGETTAIAFNRFNSLLAQPRMEPGKGSALFLEGVDPLHGPLILLKRGDCFAGALKFTERNGVRSLLASLCGQ
jgi:hypothetical protein